MRVLGQNLFFLVAHPPQFLTLSFHLLQLCLPSQLHLIQISCLLTFAFIFLMLDLLQFLGLLIPTPVFGIYVLLT